MTRKVIDKHTFVKTWILIKKLLDFIFCVEYVFANDSFVWCLFFENCFFCLFRIFFWIILWRIRFNRIYFCRIVCFSNKLCRIFLCRIRFWRILILTKMILSNFAFRIMFCRILFLYFCRLFLLNLFLSNMRIVCRIWFYRLIFLTNVWFSNNYFR